VFSCIHYGTSYDRFFAVFCGFFAVPVRGSWILKLSGTGPVRGPSKKGNRTEPETGPDFKALNKYEYSGMVRHEGQSLPQPLQINLLSPFLVPVLS
jgi:hypothetical protein